MILTNAYHQWQNRPRDERFDSLEAMLVATKESTAHSSNLLMRLRSTDIGVSPNLAIGQYAAEPTLNVSSPSGQGDGQYEFTHHSFGQLARLAEAPAGYLRSLPPALTATNLRASLERLGTMDIQTYLSANGRQFVRAITSPSYTRLLDADVVGRLIAFTQEHPEWRPAPQAAGGSRGLYRGDRDMFVFMVDNDRRVFEQDPNGGLGRGFFVWNSEVGAASFGIMQFLYEYVCQNHRIIGATHIRELRYRHVGALDSRALPQLTVKLQAYAGSSPKEEETIITRAMQYELGSSPAEVVDRVLRMGIPEFNRTFLVGAYDLAVQEEDRYGNPRSAWGLGGAITQIARDLPNADARTRLDRAAGKILALAA